MIRVTGRIEPIVTNTFKITIEGARASGKTTMMQLLHDAILESKKWTTVRFKLDLDETNGKEDIAEVWKIEVVR